MKIALCSDENYSIHQTIIEEVKKRGHQIQLFGSLLSNQEENWALATKEAALSIYTNKCREGIFFCYTGTGAAIAANKIPGIKAALCTDAKTAEQARIWNHANVLVLSNRLLSKDIAIEIIEAWFNTSFSDIGKKGVLELNKIDTEFRK